MDNKALFKLALEAKENAYSPYSGFSVGAALITKSGKIFQGANIENSSYGATICAERVAISKAVYEGNKDIEAIAIASSDNSSNKKSDTFPCGICRQFIFEFGEDIKIIVGTDENHLKEYTISELLPNGFRL